jgi:hypothetical protein
VYKERKNKLKRRERVHAYRLENQEQLNEFLWTVRDDIAFLRGLDYGKPSRSTVRVAASILRRLLVEQMYHAAWHFIDPSYVPSVLAMDMRAAVARVDPRYIHYSYAGGAPTEGAQHKGQTLLVIPKEEVDLAGPEAAVKRIQEQLGHQEASFPIADFCQSPSVIVGGNEISREAVIRYVANKLGGVHWDNVRGAWTDPVGSRHRLLDENHIMVGRLSAPLYEVLSISFDLTRSPDADTLVQRISETAPEPELSQNILRFREWRTGAYADMTFSLPQG